MPIAAEPGWFALLVLLCRPRLSRSHGLRARALAERLPAPGWRSLVRVAAAQRTAPWIDHHLEELGLEPPTEAAEALRAATRVAAARTTRADALLDSLADLVRGPEAPAMLLKGRAIEARIYPPEVMRPHVDVDLAARPGRREELLRSLTERGLSVFDRSRSGHELSLRRPGGPILELHLTALCPFRFAPFRRVATSRRLFERALPGPDGLLAPAPVDHTALLLVHLVEGIYADLRHVADTAAWMRALDLDPEAVWEVARGWRATRAVAAGLRSVDAHCPAALAGGWHGVLARAPRDPQALAAAGLRRLATRSLRLGRPAHARWVEGTGLMMHLDQPLRWAASWLTNGTATRC